MIVQKILRTQTIDYTYKHTEAVCPQGGLEYMRGVYAGLKVGVFADILQKIYTHVHGAFYWLRNRKIHISSCIAGKMAKIHIMLEGHTVYII
jgi:hypothetical protein